MEVSDLGLLQLDRLMSLCWLNRGNIIEHMFRKDLWFHHTLLFLKIHLVFRLDIRSSYFTLSLRKCRVLRAIRSIFSYFVLPIRNRSSCKGWIHWRCLTRSLRNTAFIREPCLLIVNWQILWNSCTILCMQFESFGSRE